MNAETDVPDLSEALDREAARLAAIGDPAAGMVSAFAQASKELRAATAGIKSALANPINNDVLRQAVTRGFSIHGTTAARELSRRNLILATAIGFALLLAGGGIGFWARGTVPAVVGVAAGAEQCRDTSDGGRICWIPVWQKLPPAK